MPEVTRITIEFTDKINNRLIDLLMQIGYDIAVCAECKAVISAETVAVEIPEELRNANPDED